MRSLRDQGPGWRSRQGTSWDSAGLAPAAALAERAVTPLRPTWALASAATAAPLGGWGDMEGTGRGNTHVARPPSPLQCLSDRLAPQRPGTYSQVTPRPRPESEAKPRPLVWGQPSGNGSASHRAQSSTFIREPVLQAPRDAGRCPGSLEGRCPSCLPTVGCVCTSVYPGLGWESVTGAAPGR